MSRHRSASAWFQCPTCQPPGSVRAGGTMEVPCTVARDGEVQELRDDFIGTCTSCGEPGGPYTYRQVQDRIHEQHAEQRAEGY